MSIFFKYGFGILQHCKLLKNYFTILLKPLHCCKIPNTQLNIYLYWHYISKQHGLIIFLNFNKVQNPRKDKHYIYLYTQADQQSLKILLVLHLLISIGSKLNKWMRFIQIKYLRFLNK